jgi:magnesium-transporting ATPase (P-type)
MERDLTLLGVTAVEDKLQPSVPEALEALRHAGTHYEEYSPPF